MNFTKEIVRKQTQLGNQKAVAGHFKYFFLGRNFYYRTSRQIEIFKNDFSRPVLENAVFYNKFKYFPRTT